MRQSELFTKTQKAFPKDEVSANARLLIRAGYIEKLMAGVFSMLPLGFRVRENIIRIIREEMNATGAREIIMPALHPKSVWETTGRWDEMKSVMYRFGEGERAYGLGPTHEEIIAPIVQKHVNSYLDLPIALYQIQVKFRNEERPKSGLLRGREFTMKDLYSFHTNEESLNVFYDRVKEAYRDIFKRVGLGDTTYLTFASGGSFSQYSHEFQTVSDVGEDTIYLCKACSVAVNHEIITEQKTCPECDSNDLVKKNAIEVGNIFKLGTRFSEPVGLMYRDTDGTQKPVIMASYGIGVERLMGAIVETYHDDAGLIWPQAVAPFITHLLIIGEQTGTLKKFADTAYQSMIDADIEVLYDDRTDVSAGEKFADADLLGLPWRLVVSSSTLAEDKIEVKKRTEKEKKLIARKELPKYITK